MDRTGRRGARRAGTALTAALLFTALASAPHESGTSAAAAGTTGLQGTVTDRTTGDPLADLFVIAVDTSTYQVAGGATSQTDGTYAIDLPPGTYGVEAVDPTGTHTVAWHPAAASLPESDPVAVAGGSRPTADVSLQPSSHTAAMAGTVTDTVSGNLLQGVWVLVLGPPNGAPVGGAVTDSEGHYTVPNLEGRQHQVVFLDPSGAHPVQSGPDPISLEAGTTTTVDTQLDAGTPPADGPAAVGGTVTETGSGEALEATWAIVLHAETWAFAAAEATAADGTWSLGVPVGDYRVMVVDPTGTHAAGFTPGIVSVAEGAQAVADLALAPDGPTAAITGTVTEDGSGDPVEGAWAVAVSATTGAPTAGATTAADGSYAIAGLRAGPVKVVFLDPLMAHLMEWFDDTTMGEATELTLVAGQTATADAALQPTADPVPPLRLGSPDNRLGNDPINPPASGVPGFWLTAGARAAEKENGDRFLSGSCTSAVAGLVTGCSGAGPDLNTEYSVDGRFFAVEVAALTPGQPLRIQVYDPAWTNQDGTCTTNTMSAAEITSLVNLSETTMNDGATRYAAGSTSYCAGDQPPNGNMRATSYIVRSPDDTPDDPTDNSVVSSCAPTTFSGRNGDGSGIYNRLRESTAYDSPSEQGFERVGFRQHFRQWFTICTVPAGSVEEGRYLVQVRTNPDTSGLPGNPASVLNADPAANPGGNNNYALRAGFGASGAPDGTGVSVQGEGHLTISTRVGNAGTSAGYLARVTSALAGHTVEIQIFDIGDVASGTLAFAVTPPPDARQGGATGPQLSSFAGCTIQRDGTPVLNPTVTNCGITGMTSGVYNGRTVTVRIPIPSDYWCDELVGTSCWVRIAQTFSGGLTSMDTSTWTVRVAD
jgi:hypothetical protein